jgi:quercetin dioxygenase-like cupin family protein
MLDRGTPELERKLHGAPQLIRPIAEALRLKREMLEADDEHQTITLRKGEGLSVLVMLLEKGSVWSDKAAPAPMTLTLLDGSVRFGADGGSTIEAKAGEIVACDAHVPHRCEALEDTVLLIHVGPKALIG